MFGEIGSLGAGVGTNLLSDGLAKKISAFCDREAVRRFIEAMRAWEIQFERENDGTVITSGAFCAYVKNFKVLERILTYVLDPSDCSVPQEDFLKELQGQIAEYIEEKNGKRLSCNDKERIMEFAASLLASVRAFLFEQVSLQDRGLLYILSQNHTELGQIKRLLTERFHMQEQAIEALREQLAHLLESRRTETALPERLNAWNARQIKALGERYNPDVNIPLHTTEVFEGAALDNSFKTRFLENADQFLLSLRNDHSEEIRQICSAAAQAVMELDFLHLKQDNIDHILSLVDAILEILSKKIDEYYKTEDQKPLQDTLYQLCQRQTAAEEFRTYLTGAAVQAAAAPYVVLTGDGGTGKSHLIADYIESRMASGQASLLLLSQSIKNGDDVLSRIPGWIDCGGDYYELFERLEGIAVSQQSRVLLCIDALNEGLGVTFWRDALAGIVEFLERYPHIGLIVSVRTQYEDSLFFEHDALRARMQRVEHTGFSEITYEAMHRYFSFYEITTDAVIFPGTEFSNPLFLRLFCKSRRRTHIRLEELSLPAVYKQYIDYEEGQVAEKCKCSRAYRLVSRIMDAMISRRASAECGAVRLPLDAALKLIVEISREWNVTEDVYSALTGEGILTQITDYDGNECVHITYERLEDFFVAERIAGAYAELPLETFLETYSWVLHREDLLEFLGVILAEERGVELHELFSSDDPWDNAAIREAFLYGLTWRKSASLTAKTRDYINHEILDYEVSFQDFIDLLFALSARSDHPLNAEETFHYFRECPMPDRDAEFIPVFDALYQNRDSALSRLIEWGLHYAVEQHVPDDVAERSALILCWLLISPNTELRDRATKAIICILISHTQPLIALMRRFEGIDDPYILERIHAVAFGCAVNEEDPRELRALAEYIYTAVFDKDTVYPNILLRTYAKNVIDYARYMGCIAGTDIRPEKITPPYHSAFPDIPSDEEIKRYKLDYRDPAFQDHHWAQIILLDSMKVEYSRSGEPGGYGDFGRYTFQSYFHDWSQLHPMDLKNIAIKRIFELGYDVEKHGSYDREGRNSVRVGTQAGKMERIGKKYQWIALYELAAQVSDHYRMTAYDRSSGDSVRGFCPGSFEPNIRDIDPTVLPSKAAKACGGNCHIRYEIPGGTYEEWLSDFSEGPPFEECVTLRHETQPYLLLAGNYDWTEPRRLGARSYDFPQKDCWNQIRGYIVRQEHLAELLQALNGADFMGRWMPEQQSSYKMYNKEFYWSDADAFFQDPYYGNAVWTRIESGALSFREEIMIPVRHYSSERRGDLNLLGSEAAALDWYKPCEEIFSKLHLRYLRGSNCQFTDASGELVCFDSHEVLGDESGFYIRQDKLLEFLRECGYSLVWTSLCEKRILSPMNGRWDLPSKTLRMSSVYYLKDGEITQTSRVITKD